MERFVQFVVGGGLALVAGLWLVTLSDPRSPLWPVGAALAVLGVGGLVAGIWTGIDV